MTKPVGRPHEKTGRKPLEPAPDAAARIEALAADGFSHRGVAAGLGVSSDTLRKWLNEDPDLQEAFDRGRESERHALHNMLYRQAMEKGNATAAMFLLKARHGYREGEAPEAGNRLNITFNMPAATPLADYEVIEHGRSDAGAERVSTTAIVRS